MTTEQHTLTFPSGLPGLPKEYQQFALLQPDPKSPFYLLQAVIDEQVCFILINPFLLFTHYEFDLPIEDKTKLQITTPEQVAIFAIVNASGGLKQATVNLLAPIVVNTQTKLARQVILNDKRYDIRQPLPTPGEGA